MRNLKKILALVLAMVMAFSVMSVAGAFTDDEKFSGNYAEAAEVLEGLGVFQGYPDGSFRPDQTITRAEAAALIYRIASGDTGDANKELYKYNGPFTDVSAEHWAAGYINYCANGEYIRGKSATIFDPEAKVTGYEVLAMILRVVGYDANKEFTGAKWETTVATTAESLGITGSVKGISLRDAAPRQIVAELLFRTLVFAPMVKYTAALGYQPVVTTPVVNVTAGTTTLAVGGQTLGQKVFKLTCSERTTIDKWGRPGHEWFSDGDWIATIEEAYLAQYTTAVKECQVATDIGLFAYPVDYDAYTNGSKGIFTVEPTDTVNSLGAQGRLTEVYKDRIVMIDTFLAEVTKVTSAKYDAAGHLADYAYMTLHVYDADNNGYTEIVEISPVDFSYAKGDFVLLNAYTQGWNGSTYSGKIATKNGAAVYATNIHKANSFVGAQTSILVNAKQHIVNGTTYNDTNTYFKDDAAQTPFTNFTWFLDDYGNVIGSAKIAASYTYAILKSLYWNLGTPGYATATLIDAATGTESTVTVNKIDGDKNYGYKTDGTPENFDYDVLDATPLFSGINYGFNGQYAYVAPETFVVNNPYLGYALYRVETLSTGAVNLELATAANKPVVEYGTTTNLTRGGNSFSVGSKWYMVNDNTVFTVKNGNTYTQYVGKANVPTFQTAEVFIVNGTYAQYVYIKTSVVDNSTKNFVMASGNTYFNNLWNDKNIYVLQNAYINGVLKQEAVMTINKEIDADGDGTVDGNYLDYFTGSNGIVKNPNEPFYVTYDVNGYVNYATKFAATTQIVDGNTQLTTVPGTTNQYYGKITVDACKGNTLIFLNGAGEASLTLDVTNTTVVGTAIADVDDWDDYNVYVVYTAERGQQRVATQLYIIDTRFNGQPGDGPDYPYYVVKYQVAIYDEAGRLENTIHAATWYDAKDATGVKYSDLLAKMQSTVADNKWENVPGALEALLSLKLTDEDVAAINVDASTGVATFIYGIK